LLPRQELIFYSALASKREQGNQDAIDLCITQAVPDADRPRLMSFQVRVPPPRAVLYCTSSRARATLPALALQEVDFHPFNPTDKRTEATIRAADGTVFKVRSL
jgi:hypothetical protein